MRKRIRLVLADYQTVYRQGLKSLFAASREFRIVAEVGQANELDSSIASRTCDVLLLDLQLDRRVVHEISWLSKRVAVVALTTRDDQEEIAIAIKLGVLAVLTQARHARYAHIGDSSGSEGSHMVTPLPRQMLNLWSDLILLALPILPSVNRWL
jgi:hypothetical protein